MYRKAHNHTKENDLNIQIVKNKMEYEAIFRNGVLYINESTNDKRKIEIIKAVKAAIKNS